MTSGPEPDRAKTAIGWTAAIAVLAVVTGARVSMVVDLADQGWFVKYLEYGGEIVAGRLPVDRLGDLSPGYLWAVAGLLDAGLDRIAIRTLQVVAVSVAALACAAGARARWGGLAGLASAAFVLGSRGALVNATELEPETLILVLHAVAVWRLCASDAPWSLVVAGAALGTSAVTRPTVLPAVAAIAAWLAWRAATRLRAERRRLVAGAVGFALAAATPVVAVRAAYSTIPGASTQMNPGTVLYEGLNPSATGYSGEAPRIVKEVEFELAAPDALHIAYRVVAARALGDTASAADANAFWLGRATGFFRLEPTAALRLVATKARLAVSSYEAWDLKSLAMRDRELEDGVWIPFGAALAAAVVGLALARPRSELVPPALLAAGPMLVMVAFYVTSRQRNALVAPIAVLAGAGVAALWRAVRDRRLRTATIALAGGITLAAVCSIDGAIQREDRWGWTVRALRDATLEAAERADAAGDRDAARRWRAEAALRYGPIATAADARAVCELARRRTGEVTRPAERFDLAAAAMRCGDLELASRLFEALARQGYRPLRGVEAPASVAWQRARLAMLRQDPDGARRLLAEARREAPGAVEIDAMTTVIGAPAAADAAAERLEAIHDPFTAGFAVARAEADAGRIDAARERAAAVARGIPEWPRPAAWLEGAGR